MFVFRLLFLLFALVPVLRADDLQEFIGDDKELSILNLGMDDVFNYFEPEMLMAQVDPQEYAMYDAMTADEIDLELHRLRDALYRVYETLLAFARVVASLTPGDVLEAAEEMAKNPDRFVQLLKEPRLNRNVDDLFRTQSEFTDAEGDYDGATDALVRYLNGKTFDNQFEDDDSDVFDYPLNDMPDLIESEDIPDRESLIVFDKNGELDISIDYWDPTEEYQMIVDMFSKDPKEMEVLEKMGIITLIKKILKKIRRIIKKIKKKIVLILKIIKLKALIKKTRVVICLEIMIIIEKIKALLKLIIQLIKKLIRYIIKTLPWEILWKVKVVIRLLLRILSDIIWELEILVLEVLVKVTKLLKKVKKLPLEIVYYFKMMLLEKLKMFKKDFSKSSLENDEKRLAYYDMVWDGYEENDEDYTSENETGDADAVSAAGIPDIWAYDGTPDIEYVYSGHIKIPEELEEIFGEVFTPEEMDEYLRGDDSFNFDIEWPVEMQKREILMEFLPRDLVDADEFLADLEYKAVDNRNHGSVDQVVTMRNTTNTTKNTSLPMSNFGVTTTIDNTILLTMGLIVAAYATFVVVA